MLAVLEVKGAPVVGVTIEPARVPTVRYLPSSEHVTVYAHNKFRIDCMNHNIQLWEVESICGSATFSATRNTSINAFLGRRWKSPISTQYTDGISSVIFDPVLDCFSGTYTCVSATRIVRVVYLDVKCNISDEDISNTLRNTLYAPYHTNISSGSSAVIARIPLIYGNDTVRRRLTYAMFFGLFTMRDALYNQRIKCAEEDGWLTFTINNAATRDSGYYVHFTDHGAFTFVVVNTLNVTIPHAPETASVPWNNVASSESMALTFFRQNKQYLVCILLTSMFCMVCMVDIAFYLFKHYKILFVLTVIAIFVIAAVDVCIACFFIIVWLQ